MAAKDEPPAIHFPPQMFRYLPLEPTLSDFVVESYEGDRAEDSDMFEGQGQARYINGDEYVGGFSVGMMDGMGKYMWKDGTRYEGSFRANEIRGNGTYTWADGSVYVGEVSKGMRHGHGVFKAAGGFPVYEGGWRQGMRHGRGTLTYDTDGRVVFVGEWRDNMRDGEGSMTYASGNRYEGSWQRDKKNGYGVMRWLNLREKYAGGWADDMQSGYGEHVWMDDKPAEGSLGVLKQICNLYRGEWAMGKRNGEGSFYYSNGARYSGQWRDNMKDGYGVFIFDDGHTYEGMFQKDKPADPVAFKERGDETMQVQLYVDVLDLLPCASCDAEAEIRRLEKLALQCNSELKRVYRHYCALGEGGVEHCFTLTIKGFKRFVRDCRILGDVVSIQTVDSILYKMRRHHALQLQTLLLRRQRLNQKGPSSLQPRKLPHYDEEPPKAEPGAERRPVASREEVQSLLFREFFEAIVRLAHFMSHSEDPDLPLAKATKRFIKDKIAPYVITPYQHAPASQGKDKEASTPTRKARSPSIVGNTLQSSRPLGGTTHAGAKSPTPASKADAAAKAEAAKAEAAKAEAAAAAAPTNACPLDDAQLLALMIKFSSLTPAPAKLPGSGPIPVALAKATSTSAMLQPATIRVHGPGETIAPPAKQEAGKEGGKEGAKGEGAEGLLVTRRDVLKMVRASGLMGHTAEDIGFDDVIQVLRSLFNQFSRSSYLDDTTDFSDLDTPLALDDFRCAVVGLFEHLGRKHQLRELGSLTNEAFAAPAVEKAGELKKALLSLISQNPEVAEAPPAEMAAAAGTTTSIPA